MSAVTINKIPTESVNSKGFSCTVSSRKAFWRRENIPFDISNFNFLTSSGVFNKDLSTEQSGSGSAKRLFISSCNRPSGPFAKAEERSPKSERARSL